MISTLRILFFIFCFQFLGLFLVAGAAASLFRNVNSVREQIFVRYVLVVVVFAFHFGWNSQRMADTSTHAYSIPFCVCIKINF